MSYLSLGLSSIPLLFVTMGYIQSYRVGHRSNEIPSSMIWNLKPEAGFFTLSVLWFLWIAGALFDSYHRSPYLLTLGGILIGNTLFFFEDQLKTKGFLIKLPFFKIALRILFVGFFVGVTFVLKSLPLATCAAALLMGYRILEKQVQTIRKLTELCHGQTLRLISLQAQGMNQEHRVIQQNAHPLESFSSEGIDKNISSST